MVAPVRTTVAGAVAIALGIVFVVSLSLLHVLEPEFNPPHVISEYQLGRIGGLMSVAFFCLGGASLALFAAIRKYVDTASGRIGLCGLSIIGLGYFVAGTFPPDLARFIGSLLHGIAGIVVILSSPIVFTLVSRGLRRNPENGSGPQLRIWAAGLGVAGPIVLLGIIGAFPIGPGIG